MRPGKAKGPFVGSTSGGGGGSLASALWYNLGDFTYEDFFGGEPSSEVTILGLALPANAVLYGVRVVPTIAFAGVGLTFYRLRIGIAGMQDLYLPDYDMLGLAPGNQVFGFGSVANGHILSLAGWNMNLTVEASDVTDMASAGEFSLAAQYAIIP